MRAPRLLVLVVVVVALGLAARGSWALGGERGERGRIGPPPPPPDAPRRPAATAATAAGRPGALPPPLDRRALLLSPRSARLETAEASSSSASASASPSSPSAATTQPPHQKPIFPTVKDDDDPYVQTVFAAGSPPARRAEGAALVIPERSSRQKPDDWLFASGGNDRNDASSDDPDDQPLDLQLARTLASLNTACYCRDLRAVARWRCGRCRSAAPDFRPALVHFDASWDLLGLIGYWPARKAIVVAFRGTDSGSLYNWAENMRAWRADARYPAPPRGGGGGGGDGGDDSWPAPDGMRVHSGFLNLWNSSSMATTFSDAFAALLQANGGFVAAEKGGGGKSGGGGNSGGNRNSSNTNTNGIEAAYVVGHSMGGALAHLCALDLATRFGHEVGSRTHVYTFGAPRVGNAPFSAWSRRRVASYWRFTHARDIVPSVPPQLMGFHHAAREVWLVARDAWPGWGVGEGEAAGARGARRRAVDASLVPPPRAEEEQQQEQKVPSSSSSSSLRWPSWPIWPWPPGPPPGPPAPPAPPPTPDPPSPSPEPAPPLPPGAEERAVLCDPSGEDPSCHDSVCYLGLCTSVADHLLYLGRRFYHVDAECKAPTRDEEELVLGVGGGEGAGEGEGEGEAAVVLVA